MNQKEDNTLKVAHLTLIQGVINRMANNSFLIKGWSITVLTALIAVGGALKNELFFLVTLLPIFLFWWLDAYFFMLENVYRKLYEKALEMESNDLKLNPNLVTEIDRNCICTRFNYLMRRAVLPLYLLQILISIFGVVIVHCFL
ncbi:hypothetical protein [Pseudoalteromonas sp. JC3]|uniref:hypothetical protein n=1 Tax=Pseudoalteromonas sp. JC3 TaxID=2810196 RepID=UPI0019D16901|nr:hypothetical protein [Pseudoalteromonas sp. JC3]MBR8842396.1 hypothetical protein [Pseudoalteromonas sp. JC3]WJE09484.1 hypothetical protein QSH61_03140 [Pseudoalteromonas sp. JC3]